MTNLTQLNFGEYAVIQKVEADQALALRLYAMGFRIGKKIELIRQANFNGPLQLRIGTTDVMMRLSDASCIKINVMS